MRTVAADASVHYRDIINSNPSAILVLDSEYTVLYANLAAYQLFGGTEADTLGRSVFEIHLGMWNHDEFRPLLRSVLPHDVTVSGFILEQTFPIIGTRILNLSAKPVIRDGAATDQILLGVQDVTKSEMASAAADEALVKAHAMMTEVQHRVKNNLASILSMLRLERRAVEDEVSRDVLERIALRVESMASLHELLAVNANTGQVALAPYFERVCRAIERMAGASQTGWTIAVTGANAVVSVDKAIAIGAIVNELVANAAKYAFCGRQDIGKISVKTVVEPGALAITVSDNGIGLDKQDIDPKSTGLGMRLVEMYLGNLGGAMEYDSGEHGTTCRLSIPYEEDPDAVAAASAALAAHARATAERRAASERAGRHEVLPMSASGNVSAPKGSHRPR